MTMKSPGKTEKSLGKEFLEVAIEIERNGRKFYETVAQQGKDKEVKQVFTQLAAREAEHEHTFRDMLTRLGGYIPAEPCENYKYVKSLADASVFTKERAEALMAKKAMTDVEAMETGIGFEKDAILFYSEMLGMVPRQDREILDMIINEEKKHLSELTYMANRLRAIGK